MDLNGFRFLAIDSLLEDERDEMLRRTGSPVPWVQRHSLESCHRCLPSQLTRTKGLHQKQAFERAQCIVETFDGVKVCTIALEPPNVARETHPKQLPSIWLNDVHINPRWLAQHHVSTLAPEKTKLPKQHLHENTQ